MRTARTKSRPKHSYWRIALILAVGLPLVLAVAAFFGEFGNIGWAIAMLPGWVVVMDGLLGYSYAAQMSFGADVGILLVSWLFWTALTCSVFAAAARRFRLAAITAVCVTAPVLFLSFRTTTHNTASGELRLHRSWGLITHVEQDTNSDGRMDQETWYSWRTPCVDSNSTPARSRSDENHDGSWDTWVDHTKSALQIDTDGDETADLTLKANYEGFEEARRIRGY